MMILVIEDEVPIREFLVEVLEEEGYPVQSASNGREALAVLQAVPDLPKLILLDLMMPVMDGWTFRKEQLQDPALMGVPVVVLSAAYELHRQAAILKVTSYLEKPVDLTNLLTTVARYYP
jgi:CheY-like chemotaxis protein